MSSWVTIDGNEAAASVAHRTNDVVAIYPITPSSAMGELADEWSAKHRPNIWGTVPSITEMQSEAGAIAACHGALQGGALATTFTASQGLLLMIPSLYKIAGELTPFCMHVAARTVATHALSIFGDHSDVMACRQTGIALLASASVQEAHDFALIGQAATLASRIPFLHFFDGFRTSHEVAKIQPLSDDDLRALLPDALVAAHRRRALTPDQPVLRGTAQNPDTYFQAREASAPFHAACPQVVAQTMEAFAARTGRRYGLFDYVGDPAAERVVVLMGSATDTVEEAVAWLRSRGEAVGVLKVRLYRPFATAAFLAALPPTTRAIAVLDRTKEPGAVGEPLYQDVVAALHEGRQAGQTALPADVTVIGGRYGLSSKEFTPAMACAVFDELARPSPKRHFTIGIVDDVSHSSLEWDRELDLEPDDVSRSVFFGLGADGTVGANKNSIKIIGEDTDAFAQGYFVYDSKKSGAITISHLRFGPRPIRSPYLITQASFVGCHQFNFLDRYDVLEYAAPGATVLLNAPFPPDRVWDALPREVQDAALAKGLTLYTIDAVAVARANGMGTRINTVMQTCFFALSGVLPRDQAIARIKHAIEKTYAKRGPDVVQRNFAAVDDTLQHLHQVPMPAAATAGRHRPPIVAANAPDFVTRVSAVMLAGHGDLLPVSAFPVDGTWPVATAQWEKRNIAQDIPAWDERICIQCNKCTLVCPHAAIRVKVYAPGLAAEAPSTFKAMPYKTREGEYGQGLSYTIQVAPEDCTGCSLCVQVCPAKDRSNPRHKALDMHPQAALKAQERENYAFFLGLPEADRTQVKLDLKGTQLLQPLFEYSGACAGCGETPYIKLMTQLFGDRAVIANATGCSSIYGGNLPTTPYTTNADGRGPAWANSLFEDNAEFGLGLRLSVDQHVTETRELLTSMRADVGEGLADALLTASQDDEAAIAAQRDRVRALRGRLGAIDSPRARRLDLLADYLVRKSIWIVGGDGWAYDIGFGGLDHVMALGRDVNILVLDTEVYSNTGGQQSKATPLGASAKFAIAGKTTAKKDLAAMAIDYGHVYVARIAFGAKDVQTVKALVEAESYPGPSLVIAYSHCIAHGYDMEHGLDQQKLAVDTGYWPLFRYDPRLAAQGQNPFALDSAAPKAELGRFVRNEARFRLVEQQDPERFKALLAQGQADIKKQYARYDAWLARGGQAQTPTT
ncbi:MAG: pyruvate:ferredoxin (flavodoxin) oxidoreductase [Vicinamibacterales bacterium]